MQIFDVFRTQAPQWGLNNLFKSSVMSGLFMDQHVFSRGLHVQNVVLKIHMGLGAFEQIFTNADVVR